VSVTVTVLDLTGALLFTSPATDVLPGTTFTYSVVCGATPCNYTFRVQTKSFNIQPSLEYKQLGGGGVAVMLSTGDWQVNIFSAAGTFNEIAHDAVGEISPTVSTINSTVNTVISPTVSAINAKNGNNTRAICAEGSVRKDSAGVLQMYVTLSSKTTQTVTVNYLTNKGTFTASVALVGGVRNTVDVNAYLLGAGGPLAGQTDVDTSIEIVGPSEFFAACPIYFNRAIGAAGSVSGGHVQGFEHN
jgi:hypothetical protein